MESLLKELDRNAHKGSKAAPDSHVTSEDDERRFDDKPDVRETTDKEHTGTLVYGWS